MNQEMLKRIICLGLLLIMIFSLFACKDENTDIDNGEDSNAPDIVEVETKDMVDFPMHIWTLYLSNWRGYPILLKNPDENAVFECFADVGYFTNLDQRSKYSTAKAGSTHYLECYENDPLEFHKQSYVDIIMKIDGNIAGYAVVDIQKTEFSALVPEVSTESYTGELLKSAIFPKINNEYQNVTEDYVENAFKNAKIKEETIPITIDYEGTVHYETSSTYFNSMIKSVEELEKVTDYPVRRTYDEEYFEEYALIIYYFKEFYYAPIKVDCLKIRGDILTLYLDRSYRGHADPVPTTWMFLISVKKTDIEGFYYWYESE